jgi:hypothetical protein
VKQGAEFDMRAKGERESVSDGELVDPSFDRPSLEDQPPAPPARGSHPSASVLVGGGEKQARAYVPPTALPSLGPQEGDTSSKVAIASDVDPRRMPTVKIPEGRREPSAKAGERPAPLDTDDVPLPSLSGFSDPDEAEAGSKDRGRRTRSPMLIWAVAVTLAVGIGAGAAYWVRKGMAPKGAPSGERPAKTAPATR